MFNRIKEFLVNRPDPVTGSASTSAYRFWKETELSRATAYRLYSDPSYIPTGDVLNKICTTYRIKPGVILDWNPDDEPQVVASNSDDLKKNSTSAQKTGSSSQKSRQPRALVTVSSQVRESA